MRGNQGIDPSTMTEEQKAEWETKHKEMEAKRGELPEMTEEQKNEMETKRAEMEVLRTEQMERAKQQQEAWEALTAEQKEEIYQLADQQIAIQIDQIDKYLELGLIDSEKAAEMKEKLSESVVMMRESGKMPGIGFGSGFGFGGAFSEHQGLMGGNGDFPEMKGRSGIRGDRANWAGQQKADAPIDLNMTAASSAADSGVKL